MTIKGAALLLLVVVVVLGATGGDSSAAQIGHAVGSAFHFISVAWNAAVGNGKA
jgi:hypothetical protein